MMNKRLVIRREDVDSIRLNEESTLLELTGGGYADTQCHAIVMDLVLVPFDMSDKIGDLVCVLSEYYRIGEQLDVYYYPQDSRGKYAICKNMNVVESNMSANSERTSFSFRLQTPSYRNNMIKWCKVK